MWVSDTAKSNIVKNMITITDLLRETTQLSEGMFLSSVNHYIFLGCMALCLHYQVANIHVVIIFKDIRSLHDTYSRLADVLQMFYTCMTKSFRIACIGDMNYLKEL